jgi:hypothetical protein
MERLKLHARIDEFCFPAFLGPDQMGDGVDDIDTMLN